MILFLQIPTIVDASSAPTLARSNLIRLPSPFPSLDWPSWLLVTAASALWCHLLADHRFPCISRIGIGENYAVQSFTYSLHSLSLASSKTRILYESHRGNAYTLLPFVAFATTLHFQIPATCQATTWLVVTRSVSRHPSSVLSRALHQCNFAIRPSLAICPHTLVGCALWSGPETQLYFRVYPPPLAGSSTTVHSSLIL